MIKTWRERLDTVSDERIVSSLMIQQEMQAEIDELREALQERDAAYMDGYEGGKQEARDAAHTEIDAQRKVLELALEALDTVISVTGSAYTPQQKRGMVDAAITAIQELK